MREKAIGIAFRSTFRYSQSIMVGTGRKLSFTVKHPNWRNQVGQAGRTFIMKMYHENVTVVFIHQGRSHQLAGALSSKKGRSYQLAGVLSSDKGRSYHLAGALSSN